MLSQPASTRRQLLPTRVAALARRARRLAAAPRRAARRAGPTSRRAGRRTDGRCSSCASAKATVGSMSPPRHADRPVREPRATASATTATTTGGSPGAWRVTVASASSPACASAPAGRSARSTRRRSRTCGAALGLGDEPAGLLYAVNKEYAPRDRALADGDEVALIPPVSGGAFLLSDEPLSLDRVVDEVRDGRGRRDRDVHRHDARALARPHRHHLDYEAYEGMAEKVMAEIAEELRGALRAVRGRDPPPRRPRRRSARRRS